MNADNFSYEKEGHQKFYYDMTNSKDIDLVITELGLIPPTSVPIVIREYRQEEINLQQYL